MGVRDLAEALLLQSMEDLWDNEEQPEITAFFEGEGFSVLSQMAGMNLYDQVRLMNIVDTITNHVNGRRSYKGRGVRKRNPGRVRTKQQMNAQAGAPGRNA